MVLQQLLLLIMVMLLMHWIVRLAFREQWVAPTIESFLRVLANFKAVLVLGGAEQIVDHLIVDLQHAKPYLKLLLLLVFCDALKEVIAE